MPRSLRIEYPGAIYHVINRGNYRDDVFSTDMLKSVFEQTLFTACLRSSWVLHAFCIMDNHYHLALETPEPNLSQGMQWLQSAYGNRFNRIVNSRGHVFQGRYKSLIVDRDEYMGSLLDYIHLNPVRAGIVPCPEVPSYRWSSLWYLFQKRKRPDCMDLSSCLYSADNLSDTPQGRSNYVSYLDWICASAPKQSQDKFKQMCRGWALGTKEFKTGLLEEKEVQWIESVGRETEEARFLYWERILKKLLACHGKKQVDIKSDKKSASWKVMIAHYMKQHTLVTNTWLSTHLNMGRPQGVSQYIATFDKEKGFNKKAYRKMRGKINT